LLREVEDDDADRLVAAAQRGGDGDVRATTMNLRWRSVFSPLPGIILERKKEKEKEEGGELDGDDWFVEKIRRRREACGGGWRGGAR
jgi:hypothetical protein